MSKYTQTDRGNVCTSPPIWADKIIQEIYFTIQVVREHAYLQSALVHPPTPPPSSPPFHVLDTTQLVISPSLCERKRVVAAGLHVRNTSAAPYHIIHSLFPFYGDIENVI